MNMTAHLKNRYRRLRRAFVSRVYADHNSSESVCKALQGVLDAIPSNGRALNVGAGNSRLHPRMLNLDIAPGPCIDLVGSALQLPLDDLSMDVVVSQETLEHVSRPFEAMAEIGRVLRPGGTLYLQLPFVIGYHPCPRDFWRFTRDGIRELVKVGGLNVQEEGITVGAATGFYRVSVEFCAIAFSGPIVPLYMPAKAFFSLLLYPMKLLDGWSRYSRQNDRIAGGYYVIARKAPEFDDASRPNCTRGGSLS